VKIHGFDSSTHPFIRLCQFAAVQAQWDIMDANLRNQENAESSDEATAKAASCSTGMVNIHEALKQLQEWHAAGLITTKVWEEKQSNLLTTLATSLTARFTHTEHSSSYAYFNSVCTSIVVAHHTYVYPLRVATSLLRQMRSLRLANPTGT